MSILRAIGRPFGSAKGLTPSSFPIRSPCSGSSARREDFDARHSARARHYVYRIVNRRAPLTLERGRAWAIKPRLDADGDAGGRPRADRPARFHHVSDAQCQAKSPVRTLDRLDVRREGDAIAFEVSALSFLHRQVRSMVGSLVDVGSGNGAQPTSRRRWTQPIAAVAGKSPRLRPLSGAGGLRTGRREIALQHALVDARQSLEILERYSFVDRMNGRVDEAELDDRADRLDEARVRGAPAGRQVWATSRHVFDRAGDEVGERPALGQKRDRIGRIESQREARPARRRLDAPRDLRRQGLGRPASLKRILKTSRTSAGMTFAAGLPTSTLTTSRFDGSKSGLPESSGGANRAERIERASGSDCRRYEDKRRGPDARAA